MAIRNTLSYQDPELKAVLLGFLDTASNLCEMMNVTMAAVLNEIMSIQADEACGAELGARCETRTNQRNGYRERKLNTTVGTMDLKIPKLRHGTYFPTNLLERYSRTERALAAAVAEMYITGTSTRKVERVAAKFGVDSLSKDQVYRLCALIDGEVDAFLSKRWDGERFAYLFLDATYVKCHIKGSIRSQAFISAIGVSGDGRRYFVGFTCANAESYASWRGFLQDLEERGIRDVKLITSDAHEGLKRAVSEVYPQSAWQRCLVHLKRDVLRRADNKQDQKRASALMSAVFKESDPQTVRALYHRAIDEMELFCAAGARILEDGEMDSLTYLSFPREHQVKIRTNNVQERMNCELKRRTKVVQTFPNQQSVLRLLGGIIDEINTDWASSSRFLSEDSLRSVLDSDRVKDRFDEFEPNEDAEENARVIIKMVLDAIDKAA